MTALLKKFISGIQNDPKDTLIRSLKFGVRTLWYIFQVGLSIAYFPIFYFLPKLTLTRIKERINPVIKLDYPHGMIRIHAETSWGYYRAQAFKKEPETVHWIETYLHPGEVLYDIGANIGAYSLIACCHLKGNIQINAFEPSYSTYYQLVRNILLNDYQESIHPYQMALTHRPQMIIFNYHSLVGGSADHLMFPAIGSNSTQSKNLYGQRMFGNSIDELVSRFGLLPPDHIKLDVDGFENQVIIGAIQTLETGHVKSILVEVRTTDGTEQNIIRTLEKFDFKLINRFDRGGGIIWNDVFVRN